MNRLAQLEQLLQSLRTKACADNRMLLGCRHSHARCYATCGDIGCGHKPLGVGRSSKLEGSQLCNQRMRLDANETDTASLRLDARGADASKWIDDAGIGVNTSTSKAGVDSFR